MNSSIFSVRKVQVIIALCALCAMTFAPFAAVNAQVAQGTLTVNKVISGTTTVPFTDFSFLINGSSSTSFEADGSNQVTTNVGTYDITEVTAAGYATTYSGCEDIVLTATNSPVCTITNTASSTAGPLEEGVLVINKVIVGTTSASAYDFSFDLMRNVITAVETNEPFAADGSTRYELQTGAYTVTEDTATGFSATYANSTNGDNDCENILVTPNATTTCTITNTATGGSATTTPATGVLVIKKVVGGGNGATSTFSYTLNGGAATAFEADGTNVIRGLATGTYAIAEVPAANYTPTYSNCTSAVVSANATTTCTITNNFNVGGATLYEIEGYVWHDEDEDGNFDEEEDPLQGWVVRASANGQLDRTDTTDADGHYEVLVVEGTWTISQQVQEGWEQTYPAGNSNHTVTFEDENEVTWWNPISWFLPTANAQAAPQLFNFGNAQVAQTGGGGGGGGNGVRIELTDDDDDDDDDRDSNDDDDDSSSDDDDDDTGGAPGGQVLGEATSVFPTGAPNTGFGGGHKMDGRMTLPLLATVVTSLLGIGIAQAIRERREEGLK